MKTIKDSLKEKHTIEVPWNVWTKFGEQCKVIELMGEHAFLSKDSDSGSLQELRDAVEWYVTELGGKVKWEK
jgi:hypothetical protein